MIYNPIILHPNFGYLGKEKNGKYKQMNIIY